MTRNIASELAPVYGYVAERTGSELSAHQLARLKELVERQLGGRAVGDYLRHLKSAAGAPQLEELIASVVVHKTDLFRDEAQFDELFRHVLVPMVRAGGGKPLHLWSAGCATGEEVATLLILLAEAGAPPGSTVLGTDVSEAALRQARTLAFHPLVLRRVPERVQQKYFRPSGGGFVLHPELAARASFRCHNLVDVPYPQGPGGQGFDVVCCRNVLIYFTEENFDRVVGRLVERLRVDGVLLLSAAEPLLRVQPYVETMRCDRAFFYIRRRDAVPSATDMRRSWAPRRELPPVVPAPPPTAPLPPLLQPAAVPKGGDLPGVVRPEEPQEEALRLFERLLDGAAAGQDEADTEKGLRQCLFLDPHFAPARYLLGMLLEQQGQRADAAGEYRRALAALEEGRSRPAAFFLNSERLKAACASALKRLGFR